MLLGVRGLAYDIPQFLFQSGTVLSLLDEASDLSPAFVMNDYGWDSEYVHLFRDVTVLVEIHNLD